MRHKLRFDGTTVLLLGTSMALGCSSGTDGSLTGAAGAAGGGNGGSGNAAASGGSGNSGTGGSGNAAASGGSGNSGTGGSGNSGTGGSGNAAGSGGNGGSGATTGTPLGDRLSVSTLSVSEGVKAGVSNWRIWGRSSLGVAPVFVAPLADCGTLVCYTVGNAGAPQTRVARLDGNDSVVETHELGNFECRGLAAEPDGHFGVLLWDDSADDIFVQRYNSDGSANWSGATELVNSDNNPDDFGIGESRLEYGDGKYGAYYHVHSDSGHEGDTLKWVDAASGAESTGWGWGCSHSMSNLLRYNPAIDKFMPACVTDCFPGTSGDFAANSIGGIYLNHRSQKVIDVAAGCNGSVAGELGGAALAPEGWSLVFNAHQAAALPGQSSYDGSMNQDIGFATVGADYSAGAVVWLTSTAGKNEADATIARWQPTGDATEQYVVGWTEGDGASYLLSRIDAQGAILEGPIDITASAQWGRRDDPFRTHGNGDVVWAWFDQAGSTSLQIGRLRTGTPVSCQ